VSNLIIICIGVVLLQQRIYGKYNNFSFILLILNGANIIQADNNGVIEYVIMAN